ncbi:hypothetical protein [Helicobacter sp. T3_23-1056]
MKKSILSLVLAIVFSANAESANKNTNSNADLPKISSEWEAQHFLDSDEFEAKDKEVYSCYEKESNKKKCREVLKDWHNLCKRGDNKYCIGAFVIASNLFEQNINAMDKERAILEKSCNSGYGASCFSMIFYQIRLDEKNTSRVLSVAKKIFLYLQKACDLDFSSGCARLADLYAAGKRDIESQEKKEHQNDLERALLKKFATTLQKIDKAQVQRYLDKALAIATRDCDAGEKRACEMVEKYQKIQPKIDSIK